MQKQSFLLYGANGYTGRLVAALAVQYGLQPILAGRNHAAIAALATQLQLPFLVFDLDNTAALDDALSRVSLVVHAAGPFDATAKPMIEACLRCRTHYLDLNGDAAVFELLQSYSRQAIENNIMILPGAGFDVVPTDCLALWLKNRLPDASRLQLGFAIIGSSLSRGTAITTLQQLGMPGASRKNGQLVREPVGQKSIRVTFPGMPRGIFMMSLPWGDISTAYFSTGIPDIETYIAISPATWFFLKAQPLYNWLFRTAWLRRIIRGIINRSPAGPSDQQRHTACSLVWGKVTNANGQSLTARLRCPEAYALTASSILLIVGKILQGNSKAGFQTPASAYGEDLVMEIPGVSHWQE